MFIFISYCIICAYCFVLCAIVSFILAFSFKLNKVHDLNFFLEKPETTKDE